MTVSGQSNSAANGIASAKDGPPIMDYEGSGYRTEFWEDANRRYEDTTERLALAKLAPPRGRRIAEIGAGFGRLADLYLGYEQVILFDYSRTLLQEAVQRWGSDPRFVFVAGNVYQLALAEGSIDTLVMVRVMHHLADVPRALMEIHRVLHRDSVAVLEYANKRNLKALARWMLGRQTWSPLDVEPVELVTLNYDFHPAWMWEQFKRARLSVRRQLAVSHFRQPLLKRFVPAQWLAGLDSRLFALGGRFPVSPSVFVQVTAPDAVAPTAVGAGPGEVVHLFRCPTCRTGGQFDSAAPDRIVCRVCETPYVRREGIWDFKEPAA